MNYRGLRGWAGGLLGIWLGACGPEKPAAPPQAELGGGELAKLYCVSCHAYAEPSLLGKATWRDHVLPRMGYFYGIYPDAGERLALLGERDNAAALEAAGIFPAAPALDTAIFRKICDYYLENAPDSLALPSRPRPKQGLRQFRARIPAFRYSPPSTTMLQVLPEGGFYLGDANTRAIYQFDKDLNIKQKAGVGEAPVWAGQVGGQLLVTVMGQLSPTDAALGKTIALSQRQQLLIGGLRRPVHSAAADLDGDGLPDLITCEFGKWTGGLAWWRNGGQGQFEKHVLRNKPGAIRVYVRDLNRDGRPDLLALFGQGDEGIFYYENQGGGQFSEQKILAFPPSYGSSFFDLADYNGDGQEDIIYTAGDNADYLPVLKPYHGIRVFVNEGPLQYREALFYPLPGAYAARVGDYDGDGDPDIAAISFFPDFERLPEESFVYLENRGSGQFEAWTLPESTRGRWLVMDAGDVDLDGDLDLLLGSLSFEIVPPNPLLEQWVEEGIPFLMLENQQR